MKSNILSTWEVTYECGTKQVLNLISDEDYENILKPLSNASYNIKLKNKGKSNKQSNLIEESIKIMFGDISFTFTENSPLGLSMKCNKLILPTHQGGESKIYWKKLKNR